MFNLFQIITLPNNMDVSPNYLILSMIKTMFLIGALIYVVFAIVVIRQIQIMKNTLMTTYAPFIKILGYLHFALAILVLLIFLTIL